MYNKKILQRCFLYSKRYWYRNIRQIPVYLHQIRYLIKHGYDEYATWDTSDWFATTMKDILRHFREEHKGCPILIGDSILNKMIALLDDMDENNPKYNDMEYHDKENIMKKSKDEFFKLFSEHFYRLFIL